ncbi:MAG: hypothetical protein ACI9GM_000691 [Salibacteraceae bacterium]|jgi:hypothetical protein
MRKKLLLGLAISLGLSTTTISQERFMDEVFSDAEIMVMKDQPYSVNVNWLLSDFTNQAAVGADLTDLQTIAATTGQYPQKYFYPNGANPALDSTSVKISVQTMDVYMPIPGSVDTMAMRPVVFYAHTGNFLPKGINGQPTGDKNDSAAAEICRQFAKRGYVAIAVNYRLGWNPISQDLDVRTGTLLNAVYRSIHDMKQAVRVAKKTTLGGNPFAIDPNKTMIFGQGSGGYVSLAYGSMTRTAELELDKFLDVNGASYINQGLVGGLDGYGGLANLYQDTFSSVGITSDVMMTVNAGGALADISWIEAGEPAIVSVHSIRDPYAPFDTGTVIVPGLGYPVVDVNGPGTFMSKVNSLGNNDAFLDLYTQDAYTAAARSRYGETFDYIYANRPTVTLDANIDGAFPMLLPLGASLSQNIGAPWEWWSLPDLLALEAYYASVGQTINAAQIDSNSLFGNPEGHNKNSALVYIDTVHNYIAPRIMKVLQIGGWEALAVNEVRVNDVFSIAPNPASELVTITSKGGNVNAVSVYDMTGKLIFTRTSSVPTLTINVNDLPKGVYIINVETENGQNVEKLIIE